MADGPSELEQNTDSNTSPPSSPPAADKPTEEKPDETEEKPDEAEEKPDETEEKPDDTEEKPEKTEEKADKTEEKGDKPEEKADKTDNKAENTGEKPEEKPDETEEKPDETKEKPDETEEKTDKTEEKSDKTEEKTDKTEEKSDKTGKTKPDQTTGSKPASAKKSPRGSKSAKSPRGPPRPTPDELFEREKSFLLDCIAVDSIAKDYSHCQPKLGPAIPAYNSQKDKHVKTYFTREQVEGTLRKTQQDKGGCSIDGPVIDRFIEAGSGYRYLHARNAAPGSAKAGHSAEQINGHAQFMTEAKPIVGFNGQYGYRRNTPWLRQMPSPFGIDPRSPTH